MSEIKYEIIKKIGVLSTSASGNCPLRILSTTGRSCPLLGRRYGL